MRVPTPSRGSNSSFTLITVKLLNLYANGADDISYTHTFRDEMQNHKVVSYISTDQRIPREMKPYTVHFSTQSLLQVKNKYNAKVQLTSELIFQSELLHLGHACSGEESGEVGSSKTGNL